MANDNWVGFAKSPKPDPNLSRLRVEASFEFSLAAEQAFQIVTSASGLSSWLHKTEKTEVRTSGKIKFLDVAEEFERAVFSLVDIGRRVVINSEIFGETEVSFDKKQQRLEVSFTKMVLDSDRQRLEVLFQNCLANLKTHVGAQS
jgi:cystathionine beta-lyase/cystathionine gamma-synthase